MTPIELLRTLFPYPDTISDYQLVALVFEEVTTLRIENKQLYPQIAQTTTDLTPTSPYGGWEVK